MALGKIKNIMQEIMYPKPLNYRSLARLSEIVKKF
jgi:hypothetical protein